MFIWCTHCIISPSFATENVTLYEPETQRSHYHSFLPFTPSLVFSLRTALIVHISPDRGHLIIPVSHILFWKTVFFPNLLLPSLLLFWVEIYSLWSRIMKAAVKIINESSDSSFAANSGGSSSYSAWRPIQRGNTLKRKSQHFWLCLSHKSSLSNEEIGCLSPKGPLLPLQKWLV